MIIWLASYPRSGNTFFRILLNHLCSIKTYSIYDDPLFERLDGSQEVIGHVKTERSIEEIASDDKLFFVKTHNLPKDDYPAIYLVRDGRDSIVSYAHYIVSFQSNNSQRTLREKINSFLKGNSYHDIMRNLITQSDSNYGNWSENVIRWTTRREKSVVIRFEDLIQEPETQLKNALNQLEISNQFVSDSQSFPSFEELHGKWPNFFRKGKTRNWADEMSPDLHDLFWHHHGDVMHKLNYSRR